VFPSRITSASHKNLDHLTYKEAIVFPLKEASRKMILKKLVSNKII